MEDKKSTEKRIARELYSKTVEIEKEIRGLLKKKSPLDKTVYSLRNTLRDNYEKILFFDLEFACSKEIEQNLWKITFYKVIEEYRKRIRKYTQAPVDDQPKKKTDEEIHKLCGGFSSFLSQSTEFYQMLIKKLTSKYNLKLNGTVDVSSLTDTEANKEIQKAYMICHRCMIFLGDLARYHRDLPNDETSKDWSGPSREFYLQALRIIPDNGNPYNQLAVLTTYAENDCDAVYCYFRGLGVEQPFLTARENLVVLFQKNKQKVEDLISKIEGHGANETEENQKMKTFSLYFVRLHGILFTKAGIESFDEVKDLVVKSFDDLLQGGHFDETLLLKIFAINIFSYFNSTWNSDGHSPTYAEISHRSINHNKSAMTLVEFLHIVISINPKDQFFLKNLGPISFLLDWLKLHQELTGIFSPPNATVVGAAPSSSSVAEKEGERVCWQNLWRELANLVNWLVESESIMLKEMNVLTVRSITLPEEYEMRGFLPAKEMYPPTGKFCLPPPPSHDENNRIFSVKRILKIIDFAHYISNHWNPKLLAYDEKTRRFSSNLSLSSVVKVDSFQPPSVIPALSQLPTQVPDNQQDQQMNNEDEKVGDEDIVYQPGSSQSDESDEPFDQIQQSKEELLKSQSELPIHSQQEIEKPLLPPPSPAQIAQPAPTHHSHQPPKWPSPPQAISHEVLSSSRPHQNQDQFDFPKPSNIPKNYNKHPPKQLAKSQPTQNVPRQPHPRASHQTPKHNYNSSKPQGSKYPANKGRKGSKQAQKAFTPHAILQSPHAHSNQQQVVQIAQRQDTKPESKQTSTEVSLKSSQTLKPLQTPPIPTPQAPALPNGHFSLTPPTTSFAQSAVLPPFQSLGGFQSAHNLFHSDHTSSTVTNSSITQQSYYVQQNMTSPTTLSSSAPDKPAYHNFLLGHHHPTPSEVLPADAGDKSGQMEATSKLVGQSTKARDSADSLPHSPLPTESSNADKLDDLDSSPVSHATPPSHSSTQSPASSQSPPMSPKVAALAHFNLMEQNGRATEPAHHSHLSTSLGMQGEDPCSVDVTSNFASFSCQDDKLSVTTANSTSPSPLSNASFHWNSTPAMNIGQVGSSSLFSSFQPRHSQKPSPIARPTTSPTSSSTYLNFLEDRPTEKVIGSPNKSGEAAKAPTQNNNFDLFFPFNQTIKEFQSGWSPLMVTEHPPPSFDCFQNDVSDTQDETFPSRDPSNLSTGFWNIPNNEVHPIGAQFNKRDDQFVSDFGAENPFIPQVHPLGQSSNLASPFSWNQLPNHTGAETAERESSRRPTSPPTALGLSTLSFPFPGGEPGQQRNQNHRTGNPFIT